MVQNHCCILHTNEAARREIRKTIPFIIAPKIIRYLGINLTKEVKDLCAENYRNPRERNRKRYKDMEKPSMLME